MSQNFLESGGSQEERATLCQYYIYKLESQTSHPVRSILPTSRTWSSHKDWLQSALDQKLYLREAGAIGEPT